VSVYWKAQADPSLPEEGGVDGRTSENNRERHPSSFFEILFATGLRCHHGSGGRTASFFFTSGADLELGASSRYLV